MIVTLLQIAGALLVLAGCAFLALGGLGIYRMPDTYTRIQAGTKATTLGTLMTLLGIAALQPAWAPKLLLIMVFLTATNPLSSQILARAARRVGIPLARNAQGDSEPPAPRMHHGDQP